MAGSVLIGAPSTQSPAAWWIQRTVANILAKIGDNGYRYIIHPRETAAGLTSADLVFGFDPGVAERYKCVADSGTTDNTVGLNNALKTGLAVELPALAGGYYKITAALTVNVAGTKLFSRVNAEIRQATQDATGAYNDPLSDNLGINISASNVTVEGITVTGPQNAAVHYHETGIYASGGAYNTPISNIVIRRCLVQTWGVNGVRAKYVNNLRVEDCAIDGAFFQGLIGESVNVANVTGNRITNIAGNVSGNSYGMDFATATNDLQTDPWPTDINIHSNYVYNVPSWAGIHCHFGRRVHIANNVVRYCRIGINVATNAPTAPTGSDSATDISIIGNTVKAEGIANVYRGIGINGYTQADQLLRAVIADNKVDGYGLDSDNEAAIRIDKAANVKVCNNVITSSQTGGIILNTYVSECSVTGNVIQGLTKNTATIVGGIIAYFTISGRIADNYIDATALPCVNVPAGAASTGLEFGSNTLLTTYATGPWIFTSTDIGGGLELFASAVWNPGDVTNGSSITTIVTVTDAGIGDYVTVAPGVDLAGLGSFGYVSSAGNVRIGVINNAGSTITPGSSTWQIKVTKHQ